MRGVRSLAIGGFAIVAALGPLGLAPATAEEESEDSCIACHRDPDLLVTHRRLYDYYRDWERSIHAQEGVTCSECHGGDPTAAGRAEAHRGILGESDEGSAVNFANVPATCGSCHGDVESAYRKSAHSQHLEKASGDKQGPSCVTCHDSMNTLTLDVMTIAGACDRCHNEASGNHPEVPDQARKTFNRFQSIDRFRRYVARRADSADAGLFLEGIDAKRAELSILWHTFEVERIDGETLRILDALKRKREEIREAAKAGG